MSEAITAEPLGQNIKVLSGFAFPSEGFNQLVGLPLIRIRDLESTDTEVRFKGRYDPSYLIKKGDVLIGMDGDFEVHRWTGDIALLNQRVCKVEATTLEVDQGFLYWYLKPRIAEIHRRTPQTTVRHLSASDLYLIPMPLIGKEEQAVVAQVLDNLDTSIHETEAIIAKLKAVKQGLLHDLLTRGIDANGELRPPQSEAPQLYKQSPLGWIPKEWEEVTLGEIARRSGGFLQTGPFGSQLHAHEYVLDGVPVIMPQDMVNGELSTESIARINQRKATVLSRHRVQSNDLVFSRRGDLSRCVAIEEEHLGWLCGTGCLLARLPANEVNGYWLALVYTQPSIQTQVMGRAVGSTMANLNTSILAAITIARPPVTEQNEIARRLKSLNKRIRFEEEELEKRRFEKSGLMDDLLTGRVRVTPLLEAAP